MVHETQRGEAVMRGETGYVKKIELETLEKEQEGTMVGKSK